MKKETDILQQIDCKSGFKLPENYFDNLTEKVMAQLPEIEREEPAAVTLWQRCKPWVYMAAMFAGMSLLVKTFIPAAESPAGKAETAMTETVDDTTDDYILYTCINDYAIYEYLSEE